MLTHASLFSGIGGFDLAAEWCGWKNVFQVEIDKTCNLILEKNFPNVDRYKDIKEFDSKKYANKITVLSGGFPCQPFSVAGSRKGTNDNRYLWKEMLRVIAEVKSKWVIAENVPGLLTIENGLVFEQIQTDLENQGYEVQTFIIPACSKDAPHRRDRLWIIANSKGIRRQRRFGNSIHFPEKGKNGITLEFERSSETFIANDNNNFRESEKRELSLQQKSGRQLQSLQGNISKYGINTNNQNATNSNSIGQSEQRKYRGWSDSKEDKEWEANRFINGSQFQRNWIEVASELCRVDDGFSKGLDISNQKRISALGNAIVPQIAYQFFEIINELEQQ